MTNPAPWPVVLFDFDGTLADTIPLIVASYHHTLAEAGLAPVTDDEARSWIGRTLIETFREREPDRADELVQRYRRWNLAHHDELIRTVDGITSLLDDLTAAGVRIGVVSSKRADTVELGLRAVGLAGRIEVLAGMDETARHKPHPDPLLFAADRLDVDPADCCYVGDAVVDVLAARAAGMSAVAVTWGAGERADLERAGAIAVVSSTGDLAEVLLPSGPS